MFFRPTQKINLQVASHQPLPLLSNMLDVCKTIFFISPKAGFYWWPEGLCYDNRKIYNAYQGLGQTSKT